MTEGGNPDARVISSKADGEDHCFTSGSITYELCVSDFETVPSFMNWMLPKIMLNREMGIFEDEA